MRVRALRALPSRRKSNGNLSEGWGREAGAGERGRGRADDGWTVNRSKRLLAEASIQSNSNDREFEGGNELIKLKVKRKQIARARASRLAYSMPLRYVFGIPCEVGGKFSNWP